MKIRNLTGIVFALALSCAGLFGQTVSSSVVGSVVDPADAVVAGAAVTLTSDDTGALRTATTDNLGTYRFTEVVPGTYNVTVKATGFKSETEAGIVVTAQETHDAGKLILQIGSVSESISVKAEVAQVQLSSSEKSQTVDAEELGELTLKGRDLFGYLRLTPGVIDTANRDVTNHSAIAGISINGGFTGINFTVDGLTDMDTGSGRSLAFEPNMDSIQELRVLTSNYQAEFGRNSGGTVTVVTKNGTQEFHGTAAWNHRNEEFNSDTWENNHTVKNGAATPRAPYRYNVETYSIGGPAFIPKHLNRDRKKLFFFWSQEYTGQFVTGGSESVYAPTAVERTGDFSRSFNNNGTLIKVLDPQNGNAQFPGNVVPASRINPVGQALLNFFPLPNYTATLPAQLNIVNFFEQASAIHPRRNDVVRLDQYFTSKLSAYARFINDSDYMYVLYSGVQFSSLDNTGRVGPNGQPLPPIGSIDHPNGGHGESGTVTYTISPTMVNETTAGYTWDQFTYQSTDNYASILRSLEPGLPTLYPVPTGAPGGNVGSPLNDYISQLPSFSFGSAPGNAMSYSRSGTSAGAYYNPNAIWQAQDNLSKIWGHHAFKTGFQVEVNHHIQPLGGSYEGSFSFASSTSIPLLNTNDGYANALLGNAGSYSQNSASPVSDVQYKNWEEYVQDNWKVNRRLTLDLGVRFYHQSPQNDYNGTFVNFVPSLYSSSAMSRIYVPYCSNGAATCSSTSTAYVARDPLTGATASGGFVGDLIPNSGSPNSGLQTLCVNGVTCNLYHQAPLAAAPRIGFAYDLFGDGKTAIRGGWGEFYNRANSSDYFGQSGQGGAIYTPSVSGGISLAQIAAQSTGAPPSINSLAIAPFAPSTWPVNVPWGTTENASLDIQHTFLNSVVVDIGYTLNYVYNEHVSGIDINWIPIGTGWPFTPSNLNPTTGGSTSADKGSIFERTRYPGYGSFSTSEMIGHSNYNALTSTVNKRLAHGLTLGTSFTYSKSLGTTSFNTAVPNNEEWNYGRLSTDRPVNLQVTYAYDIPGIAKRFGIKGLGIVTDHWQWSGITQVQSGAPYNPGCSLTSGSPTVTGGYTGTPDVTQRCQVLGNPKSSLPSGGNGQVYFNPAAYAMPALATGPDNSIAGPPALGNAGGGSGVLTLPRVTNFDMTLTKMIPLGSEKRVMKLQAQAYNVFNHPEFGGIGTGIQFNPATNLVSNLSSLGYATSTVSGSNRILAFSARIQF